MSSDPTLPAVVIPLMRGVVYRDTHDRAWRSLLELTSQARDYVSAMLSTSRSGE